MQQDTAYLWQLALRNALAEVDPRLAQPKIETAEFAIFRRIQGFSTEPDGAEDQALFDALKTIRKLKAHVASGSHLLILKSVTLRLGAPMNGPIKGCGKNDGPLTLYCLRANGEPSALSGGYSHVRCGYRPPSKVQNGILLCEACIERLGLLSLAEPRLAIATAVERNP